MNLAPLPHLAPAAFPPPFASFASRCSCNESQEEHPIPAPLRFVHAVGHNSNATPPKMGPSSARIDQLRIFISDSIKAWVRRYVEQRGDRADIGAECGYCPCIS